MTFLFYLYTKKPETIKKLKKNPKSNPVIIRGESMQQYMFARGVHVL